MGGQEKPSHKTMNQIVPSQHMIQISTWDSTEIHVAMCSMDCVGEICPSSENPTLDLVPPSRLVLSTPVQSLTKHPPNHVAKERQELPIDT